MILFSVFLHCPVKRQRSGVSCILFRLPAGGGEIWEKQTSEFCKNSEVLLVGHSLHTHR